MENLVLQDVLRAELSTYLASAEELIEEARNGRMFILVDDEDRENEGDLVIPAQFATPDAINFMAKYARGLICLALTRQRVEKLGLSLMALILISMDKHTPERLGNFEAKVVEIPDVLECLLITGQDADYQLKVAVKDMDAYQELLLNRITRIEGVTGVHSSFILRRVVDKTALPL